MEPPASPHQTSGRAPPRDPASDQNERRDRETRTDNSGSGSVESDNSGPGSESSGSDDRDDDRRGRDDDRGGGSSSRFEVERDTFFNSLLLPPAAAVRWTKRLLPARETPRSELDATPGALNGLLERPLRREAALIGRGRRLPAGLSLLGVLHAA